MEKLFDGYLGYVLNERYCLEKTKDGVFLGNNRVFSRKIVQYKWTKNIIYFIRFDRWLFLAFLENIFHVIF